MRGGETHSKVKGRWLWLSKGEGCTVWGREACSWAILLPLAAHPTPGHFQALLGGLETVT